MTTLTENQAAVATETETESTHPLRAAVIVATLAAEQAQAAYDNCEDPGAEDELMQASMLADEARDAARTALVNSDCPRQWKLREEGFEYDEITASSADEALQIAIDNCDRANYPDCEGTFFIDVRVDCEETGERDSTTVPLEPMEPDCADDEAHDWQSPHSLVGGLEENPGVHGNGGGVVITEVCRHCGCKRVTDTWAQNPSNGEQGLESVEYEENAFTAEELAEAFGGEGE